MEIVTASGPMGEDQLKELGLDHRVVYEIEGMTDGNDTSKACHRFLEEKVELIVFCGGDGTAIDVMNAVGNAVPVIGIPSGVKMHIEPEANYRYRPSKVRADNTTYARQRGGIERLPRVSLGLAGHGQAPPCLPPPFLVDGPHNHKAEPERCGILHESALAEDRVVALVERVGCIFGVQIAHEHQSWPDVPAHNRAQPKALDGDIAAIVVMRGGIQAVTGAQFNTAPHRPLPHRRLSQGQLPHSRHVGR